MGTVLFTVVASELLGGDWGFSFVVLKASRSFRISYIFAGIIVTGAIGLVAARGIIWLDGPFVHLEEKT